MAKTTTRKKTSPAKKHRRKHRQRHLLRPTRSARASKLALALPTRKKRRRSSSCRSTSLAVVKGIRKLKRARYTYITPPYLLQSRTTLPLAVMVDATSEGDECTVEAMLKDDRCWMSHRPQNNGFAMTVVLRVKNGSNVTSFDIACATVESEARIDEVAANGFTVLHCILPWGKHGSVSKKVGFYYISFFSLQI